MITRRPMVAALLVVLMATAGAADGLRSASRLLPGCKVAIDDDPTRHSTGVEVLAAYCLGYVDGLSKLSSAAARFCMPAEATVGQLVRVVVKDVEAHPARHNEDFGDLALEALEKEWPCPRR